MDCSPQAPLSMEFSRQEYRIRLPFPSPEDPPNPGTEPRTPALQAGSLPPEPQGAPHVAALRVSCRVLLAAFHPTCHMLYTIPCYTFRVACYTYAHTEPHVVHDHSMRCMARVFLAFVGAQLIHNVLLASGYSEVNQLCTRICPLSFRPPSQAGHCMTLRRVPCALQWVLISRLFYMQ